MQRTKGNYLLTTDKSKIDIKVVHEFLSGSYWSPGITKEKVEKGINHSMCFGIYEGTNQVGFARLISDFSTFAYLADVFVLEAHRGKGLSKWLIECILLHPDLQGLRRWMLATKDAHGLYGQLGFKPLAMPERFMEKVALPANP